MRLSARKRDTNYSFPQACDSSCVATDYTTLSNGYYGCGGDVIYDNDNNIVTQAFVGGSTTCVYEDCTGDDDDDDEDCVVGHKKFFCDGETVYYKEGCSTCESCVADYTDLTAAYGWYCDGKQIFYVNGEIGGITHGDSSTCYFEDCTGDDDDDDDDEAVPMYIVSTYPIPSP